jgi:hypothetical protein
VVFDYDVSRELASALEIGAKVSPLAMICPAERAAQGRKFAVVTRSA